MAEVMTIAGVLVGATERTYKGFANAQGEAVPGGVIYSAWVVRDFGEAPLEVRVRSASDFADIRNAGLGAKCSMSVGLFAKNNRIERSLVEQTFTLAPSNGKTAAAVGAK